MGRGEPSSRQDGWIETEATIVACKRTLLSSIQASGITDDGLFQAPDYTVEFRYAAEDKKFSGKYRTHSEQAVGSTLTIAYDPRRPGRHTGSDTISNPWLRISAWLIGIGVAALAIWLGFSDVPPL